MSSFKKIYQEITGFNSIEFFNSITEADIVYILNKNKISIEDFRALISPAAKPYLEQIAVKSQQLTQQRFGKTIQLFAPLYLSNECNNVCTYCGYSFGNKVKRKTLSDDEILREIEAIKKMGFDHVLLVTGEANVTVNLPYFLNAIKIVKQYFSTVSIEVQPLETDEYAQLNDAGIYAVLIYQETYNSDIYKQVHPKGKKSNFDYRLNTPERIGVAEMHKIGLGVLLGLDDWRIDSYYCAMHLDYLQKKYWKTKYSISFPRIRPAEGVNLTIHPMSDSDLVQLICAYRLCFPDVEISISTRETPQFRNNVVPLGVTSMSAASKTNPGGYAVDINSLEQFEIDDARSVKEICEMIVKNGYEPVFKDWDSSFQKSYVEY